MALKALLFDVDGTLADTEPHGHLPAYNRAFRELGLDWKWTKALYRKLLLQPGGRERIDHYLQQHNPELGEHKSDVERDRGAWVEDLHQIKSKHFRRRLKSGRVPLRPGVRRLMLEAVEQGLQLAIVTNASKASLKPFLAHALGDELRQHISVITSGEEVAHKKPAPDVYRLACERLGRQSHECVAVEDSAIGLQSATRAGIAVVVTVNADTRDQDFSQALLVVDQLGEPDEPCTPLAESYESVSRGCTQVDLALIRRLLEAQC